MQQIILTNLPFIKNSSKNEKLNAKKTLIDQLNVIKEEQLSIIKEDQAFRGYAMTYKVEIIEKKDPIVQLEASKSSIKDLFSDLINETKGFIRLLQKVCLKNASSIEKLNLNQFILIQ